MAAWAESRRVARGGSGPDTTHNKQRNKSSMEPARSPQEPAVYVSPQSREEQQLVKELQNITGLEAHVAQRRSHRRPARAPTAPAECGIGFAVPIAAPRYRNILSVRPYAIDATPLRYHYRHCQYAPELGPSRPLRPSRAPQVPAIESTQADEANGSKKLSIPFSICACHPCAGAMLIFSVSLRGV